MKNKELENEPRPEVPEVEAPKPQIVTEGVDPRLTVVNQK